MNKRVVWVVVVLAAVAVWVLWRERSSTGEGEARRPGRGRVAVETAPVERRTVRDASRFSGSLVPRSSFVVSPRIGGRLERLAVDIGDTVRRGDLLAVLDGEEYAQQVHQAAAELDVARANAAEAASALETARRDLDRVTSLRAQAIASESELDASRARFDAAEARVRVAHSVVRQREAGLESARIRLAYTHIHASWEDGGDEPRVVGERHVHEGAILRPNDPIVSILDIANLTAAVYAIERDYPKLEPGQHVRMTTDAWPGRSFDGTVARVAPLVREASRQARVEIDVPNPERPLRPGMFIRAEITFAVYEDACVVPVAAVVHRAGRAGVFQPDAERGVARFVPVTTGVVDQDRIQILEPALSGSVITLGQHLLDDGTEIAPAQQGDGETPGDGRGRDGAGT